MMWDQINESDGKSYLLKEFKFKNFIEAFAFMTKVAFVAEKQNHHPDWSNVYNKVTIRLNTHDKGDRVTEQDIALSKLIDAVM